jgi:hypothetical protein
MIEQASLIIGDGNWAVKSDSLLGYALPQGKYVPREMDVVRATTGTRVNAAGLVELVPYNLLQRSQEFNVSPWVADFVTLTSGFTDFNGGNTAFRYQASAGTNAYIYNLISASVGNQYTHSFYVRAVSGTQLIRIDDAYQSGGFQTTVTTSWQRVSLTVTASGSNLGIQISNGASFTTDVYICFAQTNEGSTAKPYLPTTTRLNIPRIDYSTGSAALLVERQRTNLLTYSSQFDNAIWTKGGVTIVANNTTSPSGIQDADKIVSTSGQTSCYVLQALATTNGNQTLSIYAKPNGCNWIQLAFVDASVSRVWINILTGTIGTTTGSILNATAEDAGNGWYRITATINNTILAVNGFILLANGDNIDAFTGDGTSGAFVWGAQLEEASYATSYIPTTSASVTRNADVVQKTGLSNFIGQTQGTVFVDINIDLSYAQADMRFVNVSDGTTANWYFIGTKNANEFRFFYRAGATTYVSITTPLTSGHHKFAFAYASNDYVAYMDGVQINNTTTLSVGSTSQIDVGNSFGSNLSKQFIKSAAIFKTRLTNSELQTLTSL